MDFRQLGKCLDSETSDRLREIGERYRSAQPGPTKGLEFNDIAGTGEEAAEPVRDPAASAREGGFTRGRNFTVIDGGVARTHAAWTTRRPPATPLSIAAVDGERVHGYAFSGTR